MHAGRAVRISEQLDVPERVQLVESVFEFLVRQFESGLQLVAVARTPNLDRLAREGVRYTNAFATAGRLCIEPRHALRLGASTDTRSRPSRPIGPQAATAFA